MPVMTVDARLLSASGIGTYLRNLLPRLIASHPEVDYHLLGDNLSRFHWTAAENVRVASARAPLYSVREQLELFRRTPAGSDLFWAPHYNVPLFHRRKLLVTVHDLLHMARPDFVVGAHRRAYARGMLLALRRAAARICDSRFTADEYLRLAGGRDRSTVVIYPGVDESWFTIPPGASPHPRPYLLYVGNVKPHKNIRGILRAFASLKDRIPHDLVIAGQIEGFIHGDPAVVEEAKRLDGRVHFTGWLDDDRLRQLFAHAEALLFPSYYEGFGLPPLEAMAAGCPAIVSSAASMPEVCGDAALYCDPARMESLVQQIDLLLASGSLREELRQKGIERARQFTWERCARETGEVIEQLLSN